MHSGFPYIFSSFNRLDLENQNENISFVGKCSHEIWSKIFFYVISASTQLFIDICKKSHLRQYDILKKKILVTDLELSLPSKRKYYVALSDAKIIKILLK